MRAVLLVLALSACAAPPPGAGPSVRAGSAGAAPTTRLVLPTTRDRDCADFPDRASAQGALRSGDPDRLDADRDGVACEKLRR